MSLLTDGEIKTVFTDASGTSMDSYRAIADREHTKTLKAVAEWLDEGCNEEMHLFAAYGKARWTCPNCLSETVLALREGKMPGVE